MMIDISPLNVQAEELLILKLIQFYQHAFEVDIPINQWNNSNDNCSFNTHHVTFNDLSDTNKRKSRNNTLTENKLFWFDQFIISPIQMKLSVQTAKTSLTESHLSGAKRLLPSLMSFTGAEIQLDSVEKFYMLETIPQLLNYLNTYYRLQFRAHALHIFGSVDFLGNPIGLINDLSSGISGLVELDVGGLIRHVAHGEGDSAAKVAGSVSQLLNVMSLDDKHQQERAVILGSHIDTSPSSPSSASPTLPSSSSSSSSLLLQTTQPTYYNENDLNSNELNESLNDFELTCHNKYINVKTPAASAATTSSTSTTTSLLPPPQPPPPPSIHHSFDTDRSITAPLSAGVRGLMHGIVGGMTSIVTQPYRGAKEDQFRVSFFFVHDKF
ncbi:unnamed protein product [Schistosoma turkestanicum]|nr:unnamed protein product [Schistosoma turkestanicum]